MNDIDELIEEIQMYLQQIIDKTCSRHRNCQNCDLYVLNEGYYRCLHGIIVSKFIELEHIIWEHQITTKKTE